MTFKDILKNQLSDLLKSNPQAQETLDKIFPNDDTLKEIVDSTNSEFTTDSQDG